MELVESRRYFRCRHCGTFHFPQSVAADGLLVTGQPADGPKCPVCTVGMSHALLDDDYPVAFCAKCRAVFMPRATFATVVNKRRAWATGPPAEPTPLDRRELHRELACPECGGRFDTYPHLGPGSVVIDNCTRCDMIWLDFGEMKQMVDAPGRDRGARQAPRVDTGYAQRASGEESGRSAIEDPLGFLVDLLGKE
jgi:Zn-finger nucleic acid-binding protein